MTPESDRQRMLRILSQADRLSRSARAGPADVNERHLMVHGIVARLLRDGDAPSEAVDAALGKALKAHMEWLH